MIVLLLILIVMVTPLILGPLLVLHSYRCTLPRIEQMDEDATYAPDIFRHYVADQERELSKLGFHLLDCTVEITATPRMRFVAVFEHQNMDELVFASMGFVMDSYRSPQKLAYTEIEMVSRVQDGTWIVTDDLHGLRPSSYRVERIAAGRLPIQRLLEIHRLQIGPRSKKISCGLRRDDHYASVIQESLAAEEMYDALARRELILDEENGDIKPTVVGAAVMGWKHFGISAWVRNMSARLDLRQDPGEMIAAGKEPLLHSRE